MDDNMNFKEMFNALLSRIENPSGDVFDALFVCGFVLIFFAFSVYVLFFYGIVERMYDEDVRKCINDAVQKAQPDETRKRKKKSKKKRNAAKEGSPPTGIDEPGIGAAEGHLSMDQGASSADSGSKSQKKKRKMRSSGKEAPQPSPDKTDEQIPCSSLHNEPRRYLPAGGDGLEGSVDRGEELSSEEREVSTHGADAVEDSDSDAAASSINPSNSDDTALIADRILSSLRSEVYSEGQMHFLIAFVKDELRAFPEWTKVNDKIPHLRKQLQKMEELSANESRLQRVADEQLKSLQEEMSRNQNVERCLRQRINQQRQEIEQLRARVEELRGLSYIQIINYNPFNHPSP